VKERGRNSCNSCLESSGINPTNQSSLFTPTMSSPTGHPRAPSTGPDLASSPNRSRRECLGLAAHASGLENPRGYRRRQCHGDLHGQLASVRWRTFSFSVPGSEPCSECSCSSLLSSCGENFGTTTSGKSAPSSLSGTSARHLAGVRRPFSLCYAAQS
jgi:hypothetical protein